MELLDIFALCCLLQERIEAWSLLMFQQLLVVPSLSIETCDVTRLIGTEHGSLDLKVTSSWIENNDISDDSSFGRPWICVIEGNGFVLVGLLR
jgi:hypothetical protein